MKTVNVIEMCDQNAMRVDQLLAFPDDEDGNKKAEDAFRRLAKENFHGFAERFESVMEDALERGYWDDGQGYYLWIAHSTGK